MWNSMDEGGFGKSRFDQTGGGGGGGGFLNTSTMGSPSVQEKRKSDRLTNIVACTIAQILQMPDTDENLRIGSMSAKIVTFVGLVQSVDVQSTKVSYTIDDYSGPSIEVQIWMGENEDPAKKIGSIQENTYVRITGAVRSMKGKKHAIAFKITPIKDVNEITMHILEVVHTSMAIAVMDKKGASSIGMGNGSFNTTVTTGITSSDTFGSTTGFVGAGMSKPQQIVLQAINACKDEQGISVNELFNTVKSINRQTVKEALEFLSNEGHIYSTIDEDHYKSTDSA